MLNRRERPTASRKARFVRPSSRSTLRLGRISGIEIGLHWSIALIAVLLGFALTSTILPAAAPDQPGVLYLLAGLVTMVLFLASIVGHELGHSIVAQRNGVGVKYINLFALGGVAVLDSEPRSAGASGRIALAGPAVSVGLGVGSLALGATGGALGLPVLVTSALTWLGVINLALAVFNMIPALPLDGGRVLQAALWHRNGERHQATISAARLGRYIGWGLVALGIWQLSSGSAGLWTAVIGWFIVSSARTEGRYAKRALRAAEMAERASANPGGGFTGIPLIDELLSTTVRPSSPAGSPRGTGRTHEIVDVEGRLVVDQAAES